MDELTQADRTFVRDRPYSAVETKLLAALEKKEAMMFNKQAYELIAQAIQAADRSHPIPVSDGELYISRRCIVTSIADVFEADNPDFNRSRFFLESGEVYDLGRGEANE